ncbi:MAG: PKD domain-containing protein [Candidatus Bathyarchaeota archaeon]
MLLRCVPRGKKATSMLLGVLLLLNGLTTTKPFASALFPSTTLNPDAACVGDIILVEGSGVPAGYTVYVYWDMVKPWDGASGILNASKSEPSSHFTMSMKVPESTGGLHSVWVGDPVTGSYSQSFFEVKPSLSPANPVVILGDTLEVQGQGFGNASDLAFMLYVSEAPFDLWTAASGTQTDNYEALVRGTLNYSPVKPGSTSFTCGGEALMDTGYGNLESTAGGTGIINYVTGQYTLRFAETHTANAVITVNYGYFKSSPGQITVLSARVKASSRGSFSKSLSFGEVSYGEYLLAAMDSKNNTKVTRLLMCPPITISKSFVDVGDIVSIKGSGFPPGASLETYLEDEHLDSYPCSIVQGGAVDGLGKLSLTFIVPQVPESSTYVLKVRASATISSQRMMQVDKLASLSVSLQSRGDEHTVSLQGYNFPNLPDQTVTITLVDTYQPSTMLKIGSVKTNQKGEITTSFALKLNGGAYYRVIASTVDETVFAEASFQITPLKVQLSSLEGKPGTLVRLTGSGFTRSSHWNASIGEVTLVSSTQGTTTSRGTLMLGAQLPSFRVPQLDSGTYLLVVTDISTGLRFSTIFSVLPAAQPTLINTVYPVPQLTFNKIVKEGEQTCFDASASYDPDGAIIYYMIDFGDGASSNSNKAYHTYSEDGVYKVRLTVRDNKGAESFIEGTITVEDLDPVAGFTANRRLGYKPLTVAFMDKSTSHDGLVQRVWSFGDGATSQEVNPHNTYLIEGVYTVTLTVRERDGDEATFSDTVRVLGDDSQPPVIHHVSHFRTVEGLILEAVVVDNSDIKSVTVNVPGYRSVTMNERPDLPGIYKATLPKLQEATVTITVEDYNSNQAEKDWVIKSGETRTCIILEAGWNLVEVPGTVQSIETHDLADALAEASDRLELYQEAQDLVSYFKSYRIVSIWSFDEYRGYLFYDMTSEYGDLERIEGGISYWIEVEGGSFNDSPLEVYVVYR